MSLQKRKLKVMLKAKLKVKLRLKQKNHKTHVMNAIMKIVILARMMLSGSYSLSIRTSFSTNPFAKTRSKIKTSCFSSSSKTNTKLAWKIRTIAASC